MRTILCDLLDIEYPVFQGGMAWVATGELAGAVSAAGGLGIIGAGSAPPEAVRDEIVKARAVTDRPFGVNVFYQSPFVDDIITLLIEEKVPVAVTGGGNPGKHVPALKAAGLRVIPVVSSTALAKRLERLGVDALIAEGMECGGHIGDLTTMVLVPQVIDAVNIPVIAAGGIADGRGLAAALALGAVGVQMGTRFICATECTVHQRYKEAVIAARERDAVLTGLAGHQVRCLKNKLTREYDRLSATEAGAEDFERLGMGRLRAAAVDGDVDYGSLMAGQVAAMIQDIKPAAVIIREVVTEADALVEGLRSAYHGLKPGVVNG